MSSEAASTAEDDVSEKWLELDDNFSVPTQTLDEILAERDNGFDEDFSAFEEDESFARFGTSIVSSSSFLPITYQLDCPITLNKLESISHQLRSVHDKPIGGKPTALALSSTLIAVGTNRGLTILFDRKTERLLQFMNDKKEKCSIAALKFSINGSKIAVAFSRGNLRIHKTSNGKLIDERQEIVQPGHGILHVLYISSSTLLLVDSGGSVYEYKEGRSSGARCIFTGCRGEAVNVRFVESEKLILLSTLKQVLVFSAIKSGVLAQIKLVGPSNAPPLIDVFVQRIKITQKNTATDSRFCLAKGNELRIYQTQTNAQKDLICPLVRMLQLPLDVLICNVCWLNEHYLLVMDSKEHLILVDVHRGNLIESININHVQLVYNSADFKGLSTGGNVSEALRCMAENVCYQSICHTNSSAYVLGKKGVFQVKILDQLSQLDLFEQRSDIASAVLYAIDIYYGRIHDKTKMKNLRSELSSRMPTLVLRLLDLTMDGLTSGKVVDLVDHYKRHICVLIKACVVSSHFDLLYNTIYRRLEADPLAKQVFLELLEEFVAESQLFEPPPTLMSDYLAYLIAEGQLSLFETAVTHTPISSLDLNQVMITCRQNQLFDGLIYVMNNAFLDYIGPLEEMCETLSKFAEKSVFSDSEIALGNKVLLYLSCCLAGRAFPFGQLSPELIDVVPLESYKFMISIKGKDPNGERFPNLRVFLRFDAQQFLNVICTCSDAPLFTNSNNGRLKRFVDILVALTEEVSDLSALLLSFIAHLLLKNSIPQDNDMIETLILRVLSQSSNERTQSIVQIQHSIIDLLRVVPSISLDAILAKAKAKSQPFILICAYIYTSRKQYINLLLCCMEDNNNPATVFEIIRDLLSGVNGQELEEIRLFIQNSMGRLNKLDSFKAAALFLEYFIEFIATAKTLPFDMLINCFSIRQKQGMHTICGDEDADELLFRSLFEAIINRGHADPNELKPRLPAGQLDLILVQYIHYWLPIGSNDDGCLNAAVKSNLVECSVLLLVARQHANRAFKTLFDALEKSLDSPELTERRIQLFFQLVSKCRRETKDGGWLLKLFNFLLSAKDKNLYIANFDEIFLNLLTDIVESGTGGNHEEVSSIVDALFSHKSLCDDPASFRVLLKRMLLSCQIEELMLRNTVECERTENLQILNQVVSSTRVVLVESNVCVYCNQALNQSFLAFDCSHLAHFECADDNSRQCLCIKNPKISVRNLPIRGDPSQFDSENAHQMYDEEAIKLWPGGLNPNYQPYQPPQQQTSTNPFFN